CPGYGLRPPPAQLLAILILIVALLSSCLSRGSVCDLQDEARQKPMVMEILAAQGRLKRLTA
ncbi:hypothetical protein, partial [Nitrospirillum viridazoti]